MLIHIATFIKPYGIKGNIKLCSHAENNLLLYTNFFYENGEKINMKITQINKQCYIAKIQNVTNRDSAICFNKKKIFILRDSLPILCQSEIYYMDLIEKKVINQNKKFIGKIQNIENYGGGDFITITHQDKIYTCILKNCTISDEYIVVNDNDLI